MKTGIAWSLFALLMPVCVFATTLRLSTDIGPHQIVFRVEKTIRIGNHEERVYISPPLVASFNTQRISQVNFSLPRLETEKESQLFDHSPHIELLDGDATPSVITKPARAPRYRNSPPPWPMTARCYPACPNWICRHRSRRI